MLRLFCVLAICVATSFSTHAGEEWETDLQHEERLKISQLLYALDSPANIREQTVLQLVAESHGDNAELCMELLYSGLNFNNQQIREGVIDVLAYLGKKESIPPIISKLRYDTSFAVRTRIIRMLPAFLITENERHRAEFISKNNEDIYMLTDRLRSILRAKPYRQSSQDFNSSLNHTRKLIIQALAEQLDPIETAINGLDAKKDGAYARKAILILCGKSLGKTRADSLDKWRGIHHDFNSPVEAILTTLKIDVCTMLVDIGAEGTPFLIEKLDILSKSKHESLRETALETIAQLCMINEENAASANRKLQSEKNITELEDKWLASQIESHKRLSKLAFSTAVSSINDESTSVRIAALKTIGVTHSEEAADIIGRKLRAGTETLEIQAHMAQALGEIGNDDAVKLLASMAEYQGFNSSPEAKHDEYRIILNAVTALAKISGEYDLTTRKFHYHDAISSRKAYEKLLRLLSDNRKLPAAPKNNEGQSISVSDLVLFKLQQLTGLVDNSKEQNKWAKYYEELVLKSKITRH